MGKSASPVQQVCSMVDELGDQVTREAEETASVMTHRRENELELAARKEENQQLLQQQARIQQQEAAIRKDMEEYSASLRQMEEQVRKLIGQRNTPAPLHIIEATRSQISSIAQDYITEEVKATLIDFKSTVESRIDKQHGHICEVLWERLEPSLILTERIYNWFNSQMEKQAA